MENVISASAKVAVPAGLDPSSAGASMTPILM